MKIDEAMTFDRALRWLVRDSHTLHASAIDLQFARDGFGIIVGSIAPVCVATRALLTARPGAVPTEQVVAHLHERANDEGWRYFDNYLAIPPDSDDLGLVLHVLAAAGVSPDEPWVAAPLRHLARNRRSPGMFPTWLVTDPDSRSTTDEAWASGTGSVHPEVVANLCHALLALNAVGWTEDLVAAAGWLASSPGDRLVGNHWYYGLGYAGWMICAFLRATHTAGLFDAANSLALYRELLAGGQNELGAWPLDHLPIARVGLGRAPRPVLQHSVSETAWRVAALRAAGVPARHPMLSNAVRFLAGAQQSDGGFAAEPFFETLSVDPYGSRTTTAAAVVHALAP
jgi:hypothetical protein